MRLCAVEVSGRPHPSTLCRRLDRAGGQVDNDRGEQADRQPKHAVQLEPHPHSSERVTATLSRAVGLRTPQDGGCVCACVCREEGGDLQLDHPGLSGDWRVDRDQGGREQEACEPAEEAEVAHDGGRNRSVPLPEPGRRDQRRGLAVDETVILLTLSLHHY